MRHVLAHMEEMKTPRFAMLEESDPGIAARARAHTADHMRKIALQQEQQEKMMADMAQAAAMQGLMAGGEGQGAGAGAAEGAASPDQDQSSPKNRRSETGGPTQDTKSKAMAGAPNGGAQ